MDKPYRYECKKHGVGWSSIDECPKCMEDEYIKYYESYSTSICWICRFGSEPTSFVPCQKFKKLKNLRQIPRKKCCKWFKECEPDCDF